MPGTYPRTTSREYDQKLTELVRKNEGKLRIIASTIGATGYFWCKNYESAQGLAEALNHFLRMNRHSVGRPGTGQEGYYEATNGSNPRVIFVKYDSHDVRVCASGQFSVYYSPLKSSGYDRESRLEMITESLADKEAIALNQEMRIKPDGQNISLKDIFNKMMSLSGSISISLDRIGAMLEKSSVTAEMSLRDILPNPDKYYSANQVYGTMNQLTEMAARTRGGKGSLLLQGDALQQLSSVCGTEQAVFLIGKLLESGKVEVKISQSDLIAARGGYQSDAINTLIYLAEKTRAGGGLIHLADVSSMKPYEIEKIVEVGCVDLRISYHDIQEKINNAPLAIHDIAVLCKKARNDGYRREQSKVTLGQEIKKIVAEEKAKEGKKEDLAAIINKIFRRSEVRVSQRMNSQIYLNNEAFNQILDDSRDTFGHLDIDMAASRVGEILRAGCAEMKISYQDVIQHSRDTSHASDIMARLAKSASEGRSVLKVEGNVLEQVRVASKDVYDTVYNLKSMINGAQVKINIDYEEFIRMFDTDAIAEHSLRELMRSGSVSLNIDIRDVLKVSQSTEHAVSRMVGLCETAKRGILQPLINANQDFRKKIALAAEAMLTIREGKDKPSVSEIIIRSQEEAYEIQHRTAFPKIQMGENTFSKMTEASASSPSLAQQRLEQVAASGPTEMRLDFEETESQSYTTDERIEMIKEMGNKADAWKEERLSEIIELKTNIFIKNMIESGYTMEEITYSGIELLTSEQRAVEQE